MKHLDSFRERIREATSLVELVPEITSTHLKRSGKEFKGLCPFHQEKNPSFCVTEDGQKFYCHSCNEGGDLFSFVRKYRNYDYMEALTFLADRLDWEVPKAVAREGQDFEQSKQLFLYSEIMNELKQQATKTKKQSELDFTFKSIFPKIAQLGPLQQQRVSEYLADKPYNIKLGVFKEKLRQYQEGTVQLGSKIETKTLIPDLVHLVKENGKVSYLLEKGGKLRIENRYRLNGVSYQPKQDLPIKIPDETILKENMDIDYKKLLDDVISFIRDYVELPEEWGYFILALWVLHTYLMEKFNSTPIIYFYGVWETGKSRAGEVLVELAYFAEWLTSPTEATLFREAEHFKTALIVDEIRLWGSDANQEVARLVKSRYKRGVTVPRCNQNKSGEDMIEYFDVFAPLVICSTEGITHSIESRCIIFLMEQNISEEVEESIDEERASDLRKRLTIFRANKLKEEISIPERITRRRLNEILKPLYEILMITDPERKEEFKTIVEKMEAFKKQEESLGLDAEIIQKISNFYLETQKLEMEMSELTRYLNEEREEREKIKSSTVGIWTKRLGFKKKRLPGGGSTLLLIKPERLNRLKKQYKIE